MKYESTQYLADLQVECSNKDKTIQEQEKYIEETKDDLQKLQVALKELHKKQIETEEQHTKDIETMVNIFLNKYGYFSISTELRRQSRRFVVFLISFLLTFAGKAATRGAEQSQQETQCRDADASLTIIGGVRREGA